MLKTWYCRCFDGVDNSILYKYCNSITRRYIYLITIWRCLHSTDTEGTHAVIMRILNLTLLLDEVIEFFVVALHKQTPSMEAKIDNHKGKFTVIMLDVRCACLTSHNTYRNVCRRGAINSPEFCCTFLTLSLSIELNPFCQTQNHSSSSTSSSRVGEASSSQTKQPEEIHQILPQWWRLQA